MNVDHLYVDYFGELAEHYEELLNMTIVKACNHHLGKLPVSQSGIEDFVMSVMTYHKIDPALPCKYPRGSLGRVITIRKRYQVGIPFWNTEDCIETLEENPEKENSWNTSGLTPVFNNSPRLAE